MRIKSYRGLSGEPHSPRLISVPIPVRRVAVVLLGALLVAGCSTTRQTRQTERPAGLQQKTSETATREYNSRAIAHYMDGVTAELQGNYALAALEYQQALRYDSSSATIYADLSNAFLALHKAEEAEHALKLGLHRLGETDDTLLPQLARIYFITGQNDKALDAYTTLMNSTSTRSLRLEALEHIGDIRLREKKYSEAAQIYERIYRLDNHRRDYLVKAQSIYVRMGEYGKAQRVLDQLIRDNPDETQFKVEKASIYSETGKVDSAKTLLQPVASQSPTSDAAALLGELYFQSGQMDSAYSTLKPLYQGDSTDVRVLYYLGGASLNLDQFQEAERYYRELMGQHQDVLGGYFGLGITLRSQKRYREAIEVLSRGIQKFPDEPQLYEHLGMNYYLNDQPDSAWKNLDKAFTMDSTLTGYFQLAEELRTQDRVKQALEVLSRAHRKEPSEPELYEQIGITYFSQQEYQEAKSYFLQALSIDQTRLRPKHYLAFAYDYLSQPDSAETMYKALLKAVPDEPLYLNNLAYLYASQGKNLPTALRYVKEALQKAPGNPSYLDTMGWVYYQMGQYREALGYIRQALEQDSTNAEVLDHMGDVYHQLGNREKAQEFYRRALQKSPDDPAIRRKLQ